MATKGLVGAAWALAFLGSAMQAGAQSGPAYLRPPLERIYGFCQASEPNTRAYFAVSSVFSVPGSADAQQVAERFERFAESALQMDFASPECRLFFGDEDRADGGRMFTLQDLQNTGRQVHLLEWSDPQPAP